MKKILCLFVLSLAIFVAPAHAETISLTVTSPVVVGSSFDVLVQVANLFDGHPPSDNLGAFEFNVDIDDSSIFQYTGETIGSLFDDFSDVGSAMVLGFTIDPAGIAPDFTGLLTLATLHFTALAPGSTVIGVSGDPDLFAGLEYFSGFDAITASTNVATAPEPGALILLGFGLAMLLFACRRKRFAAH
jgi:PEP-CTERM motif